MKLPNLLTIGVLAITLNPLTLGAEVLGPIKVSPNGRHFVDRNGQPIFWLGDTAWPLFAQYSRSQAEAYLRNRSGKGFTVFIHLDKIAGRTAKATWINPATGERQDAGTFLTGNLNGKSFPERQVQHFSTPGHWEDAVLLLESQ